MSGQQSNYVSRGGNPTNNKWSLDGVDITDMSATGASPSYYDFDAFEEMTINTGGVDVTQQTGGVGINLVTKSGTDRFKGSSRFYITPEKIRIAERHDRAARSQGASSGNPIQDIKDYGVEAGGPIKKGRAWVWGSFGKQIVDVGVVGFYKPTAAVPGVQDASVAAGLRRSRRSTRCLNTDQTLLQTTNLKAEVAAVQGQQADDVQQLRQEGAQRARRVGPEPDRDDHAAERGAERASASTCGTLGRTRPTSSAISGSSATGCSLTCSTRTSATTSSSACTTPDLRDGAADADRFDRPERPLGARRACSSGRSTASTSTRTTSCRARWAATTR